MEIKQLEPKDKVLTFFGEIKSTTVENTIKDIVKINLADRDYINKCNLGFAFINFLEPFHIILFYELYRGGSGVEPGHELQIFRFQQAAYPSAR